MPDVRSMCAIGVRGQLGLNGQLPWEGAKGPEYKADVENFFRAARGHVLLAGPRTARAVPDHERRRMTVVELRSHMSPEETLARFAGRVVFIGGGPPVWDVYAPFIRRWDITRLPYDGEADRWFDPAWLLAAKGA
jgi:dihydromethanopterin reductase